FRGSEIHRSLLAYLVDRSLCGTADALKEYTVALEVFHKPPTYDPRQESTVRVHMARLRQKLAEYYQTEGAADTILITLPKGAFKIQFATKPQPPTAPIAPVPEVEDKSSIPAKVWVAMGALAVMSVALAWVHFGPKTNSPGKFVSQSGDLDK